MNHEKTSVFIALFIGLFYSLEATYTLPPAIGYIKKAYVEYKDSRTVTITPGYGEINGYYWEVTQATDLELQPPSNAEFVYIYIDHSESNYPSPEFIGSTDEPAWSDERLG